jgi:hypothetical protein
LRRELKLLKQTNRDKELVFITKKQVNLSGSPEHTIRKASSSPHTATEESKMIEMQREEIKRLRKKVSEFEAMKQPPRSPFSSQRLLHHSSPLLDIVEADL